MSQLKVPATKSDDVSGSLKPHSRKDKFSFELPSDLHINRFEYEQGEGL